MLKPSSINTYLSREAVHITLYIHIHIYILTYILFYFVYSYEYVCLSLYIHVHRERDMYISFEGVCPNSRHPSQVWEVRLFRLFRGIGDQADPGVNFGGPDSAHRHVTQAPFARN